MKKLIIIFFALSFSLLNIFCENSKYFKSELISDNEIAEAVINPSIISEAVNNFIKGTRDKQSTSNELEEAFYSSLSSVNHIGSPELVYNSQAPWFYKIPLLDKDDFILDFLLISPYDGKILSYPSFSLNGSYERKGKYVSRVEMNNKITNYLNQELYGEYKEIRIVHPDGIIYNFISVQTPNNKHRIIFDDQSNIVIFEKDFNQQKIISHENDKGVTYKPDKLINIDNIRYDIDDFTIDYLIPEYADLPIKDQSIDSQTVAYVNTNMNPVNQWQWQSGALSYKCLSYASSTVADWWRRYSLGDSFTNYYSLLHHDGNSFQQESGTSPRLLELVYHENIDWLDPDFDYPLGGAYNDPVTDDEIPFDLKGYCRILTHENIDYFPQSVSEPLFNSSNSSINPFLNYYEYDSNDDLGCGNNWNSLPENPTISDYNLYLNKLQSNGPLLTWNASTYLQFINFLGLQVGGHAMAAVGIGSFNGTLQYGSHTSNFSDKVLICQDSETNFRRYKAKTFGNGESYFGVWQAYYFHDETTQPVVQSLNANLDPQNVYFDIHFNESMKPDKLDTNHASYTENFVQIIGATSGSVL